MVPGGSWEDIVMQEHLADLVHPIFDYALGVKERLEKGQTLSIELEQANLKGMLLTEIESRRYAFFGGEEVRESSALTGLGGTKEPEVFLGARFALTCWLDELFIVHTPWAEEWNERKLEVTLYQSNDRAWPFWQQAQLAERRPTTDALEVVFLCVMLGFRGDMVNQPEKLHTWYKASQNRLSHMGEDWSGPPELEVVTNVPPLHGQDWFQTMVFWTSLLLLVMVPLASFLLMQQFSE